MIEMLGVLAIIGVLSVGGIAGYSKAMHKYRVNKAIEQITLIAGNVRAFFGPQKNYIGLTCTGYSCNASGCAGADGGVDSNGYSTTVNNGCPIIKKAKILPDEMITVNAAGKITAITNPFGGSVGLGSSNKAQSSGSDNQAFYIEYIIDNNIEACIELLSHDWSSIGVTSVNMNGAGPSTVVTLPVELDEIVSKCSSFSSVYLYFNFTK